MTKKLYLIISFILLPVIAEGADWVKVVESKDKKEIFYVDVSSIKQSAPNQYRVWYKVEFKNVDLSALKESKAFSLFDCVEREYKELQITHYNIDGSFSEGEQDWQYVIPDSNMEAVFAFVCTYKKGVLLLPKREHE